MKPSIPTISAVPLAPRIALGSLWRYHIDALPDEIVRCAFEYLNMRDRRYVAQVCARWRMLASGLVTAVSKKPVAYMLPWNVLKRVFSLLDPLCLIRAARVCVRWETIALSFFSCHLGRRHVHDLPAEVIKQSFALLDFDNLRYAAQVCVRWRDLGIEHPGFWKNVEVRSATRGSMDLLEARLGQSNGRPFSFSIDIEGMHPLIQTRLFGLLTAMIPSVQNLRIRLDSMYIVDLWPVLNHAAPQLADFYLKLYSPDRIMPRVPLNFWIFDRNPGLLSVAHIEDVLIAEIPQGLPAFANLRKLSIVHPSGSYWNFPGFVLEYCPSLKELIIYCGTITFDEKLSDVVLQRLRRLTSLEVYLDCDARTSFVQNLPMRDIPIVVVGAPPDFDAFYDFLEPVRSPFRLRIIRGLANFFFISVEDDAWGYQRVFQERMKDYDAPPEYNERANLLFENNLFPAQVVSLHISASLWKILVPYLSLYCVVDKLILDLDAPDSGNRWVLPTDALKFSNLVTLVLEARNDYIDVEAEDVVHFVDNVLSARRCRYLELNRVLLSGERRAALQRFESVSYSPKRLTSRPVLRKPKL